MKWKIKDSYFDEGTGISRVIITTDLGEFEGISLLHDEDRDITSHFEGCRYAELRAVVKYIKAKIRNQKIKVDTIKNLIINMENLYNYAENTPEARFVRKQYYMEEKKLRDLKNILQRLQDKLLNDMKGYRNIYQTFLEKIGKYSNKKNGR